MVSSHPIDPFPASKIHGPLTHHYYYKTFIHFVFIDVLYFAIAIFPDHDSECSHCVISSPLLSPAASRMHGTLMNHYYYYKQFIRYIFVDQDDCIINVLTI